VLSERRRCGQGPRLLMAGAGMCTGGRILHHFRHNLSLPETTVLMVGYQGHGSLGRLLVDGRKEVTIFGQRVPVRASVHTFGGLVVTPARAIYCTGSNPLLHRARGCS